MKEIATISFTDVESGDEATAIVRAMHGAVALAISLKRGGDLEVALPTGSVEDLVSALKEAARAAGQ